MFCEVYDTDSLVMSNISVIKHLDFYATSVRKDNNTKQMKDD